MQKKVLFRILILAVLFCFVQSLSLRTDTQMSHKIENVITTRFTHQLIHHGQIPPGVLTSLTQFIKNDKEISQSIIDNKPLSQTSADKVKKFLLQNKDFQNFSIETLTAKATNPDCMKGINDSLKVKLLKMILDEWDFKEIFLEKKEDLNDPEVHDIISKLEKEKDIKAELDRCFASYE